MNLPHSEDSTQKDPNGWHSIPGFELPIFGALVSFVRDSVAPFLLLCWFYISLFTSPCLKYTMQTYLKSTNCNVNITWNSDQLLGGLTNTSHSQSHACAADGHSEVKGHKPQVISLIQRYWWVCDLIKSWQINNYDTLKEIGVGITSKRLKRTQEWQVCM